MDFFFVLALASLDTSLACSLLNHFHFDSVASRHGNRMPSLRTQATQNAPNDVALQLSPAEHHLACRRMQCNVLNARSRSCDGRHSGSILTAQEAPAVSRSKKVNRRRACRALDRCQSLVEIGCGTNRIRSRCNCVSSDTILSYCCTSQLLNEDSPFHPPLYLCGRPHQILIDRTRVAHRIDF